MATTFCFFCYEDRQCGIHDMMGSMIVIYEYDISTNMDGYSSAFLD